MSHEEAPWQVEDLARSLLRDRRLARAPLDPTLLHAVVAALGQGPDLFAGERIVAIVPSGGSHRVEAGGARCPAAEPHARPHDHRCVLTDRALWLNHPDGLQVVPLREGVALLTEPFDEEPTRPDDAIPGYDGLQIRVDGERRIVHASPIQSRLVWGLLHAGLALARQPGLVHHPAPPWLHAPRAQVVPSDLKPHVAWVDGRTRALLTRLAPAIDEDRLEPDVAQELLRDVWLYGAAFTGGRASRDGAWITPLPREALLARLERIAPLAHQVLDAIGTTVVEWALPAGPELDQALLDAHRLLIHVDEHIDGPWPHTTFSFRLQPRDGGATRSLDRMAPERTAQLLYEVTEAEAALLSREVLLGERGAARVMVMSEAQVLARTSEACWPAAFTHRPTQSPPPDWSPPRPLPDELQLDDAMVLRQGRRLFRRREGLHRPAAATAGAIVALLNGLVSISLGPLLRLFGGCFVTGLLPDELAALSILGLMGSTTVLYTIGAVRLLWGLWLCLPIRVPPWLVWLVSLLGMAPLLLGDLLGAAGALLTAILWSTPSVRRWAAGRPPLGTQRAR